MKKYDYITAPYSFKEFYSKYPQGYTIFEALLDWLEHVNSMTDQINVTVDEWLNLKTFINEELKTYSNEQLQSWLDDGTLEGVINDALFNSKADKSELVLLESQMAQIAINPDDFEGSDSEKVQQAIDTAILNGKSVRFSRMFDITDSTITLNKPSTNRAVLYLIGLGGGIVKNDSGYVFTATSNNMGDIVSSNMKYRSVNGAETVVWDGNTLIRLFSQFDSYVNVDTVFEANERYAQSIKFYGCTITGGFGWAFEWKKSYDTLLDGNTIEHREHGIRNTVFTNNPDNNTLRIVNNVIEGLTGKAIELGSSFGGLLQGNYFEFNIGGDIDLSKSENFHNGLTIISNTFQPTTEQKEQNIPSIKLGRFGTRGVFSSGNVTTGALYELVTPSSNALLTTVGDMSYKGPQFVFNGSLTAIKLVNHLGTYTPNKDYGLIRKYFITSDMIPFSEGEVKNIIMETDDFLILPEDLVTIKMQNPTGSFNIEVLHYRVLEGQIIVNVKNNSGPQSIRVAAIVLKIGEL